MTYFTGTQIHDAIDAMAEAKVDESIAETIKDNIEYNAKYDSGEYTKSSWYRPQPTKVEEFDREEVRDELAEGFYEAYDFPEEGVELPGLGTAKLVDSYGGEGKGEEYWRIYEINGQYYKADHYYSSYDGSDPWHGNCTIFPVVGKEVVKTAWVRLP